MKMWINKQGFPKEESLSSDFLDLLERVKCKGSKKCNENDKDVEQGVHELEPFKSRKDSRKCKYNEKLQNHCIQHN